MNTTPFFAAILLSGAVPAASQTSLTTQVQGRGLGQAGSAGARSLGGPAASGSEGLIGMALAPTLPPVTPAAMPDQPSVSGAGQAVEGAPFSPAELSASPGEVHEAGPILSQEKSRAYPVSESRVAVEGLLRDERIDRMGGGQASGNVDETASRELFDAQRTRWLLSERPASRAVAVLVHGLNLRPSRMDSIARELQENGVDVLRVALAGHRGNIQEFEGVTREEWLRELEDAYRAAKDRASSIGRPLHFVGYSMGGLLQLDLMNSESGRGVEYDRMVLFAPGIAFWPSVRLLARATIAVLALRRSYAIPSAAPEEYRMSRGTPVAAYSALMESASRLAQSGHLRSNRPTLVFQDPKDEFVSLPGLREVIGRHRLDRWRIVELAEVPSDKAMPRHLVIDERSVGGRQWQIIRRLMKEHLGL